MVSSARLFTAMALVVMPVTTGMYATPTFAAEAVGAKGGCWGYTVAGTTEVSTPAELFDATTLGGKPGASAITDGVKVAAGTAPTEIKWTPDPAGARLDLTSTGSTAKDGKRSFALTLDRGPALSPEAVKGDAHAVLEVWVNDAAEPKLVFASTPFAQEAGAYVADLSFTTNEGLDLTEQGAHRVVLKSLYFVAPVVGADGVVVPNSVPQMWACNGQAEAVPTDITTVDATTGLTLLGANPATAPVQVEGVAVEFQVADATTLTLGKIVGQTALTSVRAGDEVVINASGLATSTEYSVGFGPAAGPFVVSATKVSTDAFGAVATAVNVVVPEGVASGEGVVTLLDASGAPVGAQLKIVALAAPSLTVEETVGDAALELTVSGANFDPSAEVRLRSRVGDEAGTDTVLTVDAGLDGTFSATYEVRDVDADTLRALQRRVDGRPELAAVYEIAGEVPVPATPTASPSPSTSTPATTAPAPAPVAVAPVAPPVQIPIPVPLPVVDVTDVPGAEPSAGESALKVSKTRLEGSPGLGELFGGSAEREVRFEVENTGTEAVSNPQVMLGVGRTEEAQPTLVAAELGDLDPGARVAVGINVSLPMASFGTYQVVGQVGDDASTAFTIRWDTYPWGLISVNALGLGLLVWGVNRRRNSVAPLPAGPGGEEMGASVVDLTALDKWWQEGKVVHSVVEVQDDNDSVVDLDAADRWWARNQHNVS